MPPLIRKIEPGDVIGRCRLIRELGRGGVGTVYLAAHQTLRIEVALKILSPSLTLDNPALAERFIRESQLAARIRHTNVITVMDAAHDEETGLDFIVMEYIGGGSLSWHLRHGPLPEAKTVAIMIGIAQALVVAEENKIVHRDIKPDNILLDLRGTPKLADLGMAKHTVDSRTSITLGGSFMGTPAYMSPEQARDAKIADTRDDIYSLGATFFECLTGTAPFQGETPYNIMSELLTKPSPIASHYRRDVSRSADIICRKMMAKSRHLRYANARILLQDLQILQTHGDQGFDRLDASNFENDFAREQQQARTYGIETSPEGVALLPDDAEAGPIDRPVSVFSAPRRTDYGVFGAAALLIAMVTMATLVLAWVGPQQPVAWIKNKLGMKDSVPVVVEAPVESVAPKKKKKPVESSSFPATSVDLVPPDLAPVTNPPKKPVKPRPIVENLPPLTMPVPQPTAQTPVQDPSTLVHDVIPVAPPANPADLTNAVPVSVPAVPVVPAGAFASRLVAESALPPDLVGTTGAELLKIVGKRDSSGQQAPATWSFYFYDKAAHGHARIITVSNGEVLKKGEDVVVTLNPFRESDIVPENKLATDSSQALQIAEGLLPAGVTASSSQMELSMRRSVPSWRVTLWVKNDKGDEIDVGSVSILAEQGIVSENLLKVDKLQKPAPVLQTAPAEGSF